VISAEGLQSAELAPVQLLSPGTSTNPAAETAQLQQVAG